MRLQIMSCSSSNEMETKMDQHANAKASVSPSARPPPVEALVELWQGLKEAGRALNPALITAMHARAPIELLDSAPPQDLDDDAWRAIVRGPLYAGHYMTPRAVMETRRSVEAIQSAFDSVPTFGRRAYMSDVRSSLEAHLERSKVVLAQVETLCVPVDPPRQPAALRLDIVEMMLEHTTPSSTRLSELVRALADAPLDAEWRTELMALHAEASALVPEFKRLSDNPNTPMAADFTSLSLRVTALREALEDLEHRACAELGKLGVPIFNRVGRVN